MSKYNAEYHRKRRLENPLYYRERNRKYREDNPEKTQAYVTKYVHNNPAAHMCSVARHRAKKRGIEFLITKADINIPEFCPVLGIKLVLGVGKSGKPGGNPNSPSIDRTDSSKGYIPGNVTVMSHLANSMKGSATVEQLRAFATWVRGNYDE